MLIAQDIEYQIQNTLVVIDVITVRNAVW